MSDCLVIKRPDGVSRNVDGYLFREPDSDAKTFAGAVEPIPAGVDLRRHMGPIEDHGESSSCVTNAVAAAYEYLLRRHTLDRAYAVSRLFIYYNARETLGEVTAAADIGIVDALTTLRERGACSQKLWPYDVGRIHQKPSDAAYAQAEGFLVQEIERVPTDLEAWKKALAEGYPIVFGLYIYSSFDRQQQPGLIPIPTDGDLENDQGEHCMVCVGYSEGDQVFIVRNSWGPAWGDEGYGYIPFAYLMDPELNRGDAWIARRSDPLEKDATTWNERSVLDDVDNAIGQLDSASWSALLDALGEVSLETRIALIFLAAADADSDITDAGLGQIVGPLEEAFDKLGCPFEADRVLRSAVPLIDEGALIDDSIILIGEHFAEDALADIVRAAGEAAGFDDMSEADEGTVADLIDSWLGGAAPRAGGLVDGLPGEYDGAEYSGGVYGDDDEEPDDFSNGFNEVDD